MTPTIFIAGTDTGVGKTRVATLLCRALRERGLRVGVFKPAETGCVPPDAAQDALALIEASGCTAPLDIVCPYRLPEPLAPAVAAERAGVAIDLAGLDRCLQSLQSGHDVVVCEGAGGLLVPLAPGTLTLDWIAAKDFPVLLVGRLGLGTINHTLLSARCLAERGVRLLATVLSATVPPSTVAEATNEEVLRGFPEVRLAGVVGYDDASALPKPAFQAVLGELLDGER